MGAKKVSVPLTDTRIISGRVVSVPLTSTRRTNGWVVSVSPALHWAGDFPTKVKIMFVCGFYILKNDFFDLIDDPYLKHNKGENRPFYYCVKETTDSSTLYWMIPLSSRVDKFKRIIAEKQKNKKPCDGIYICKLPNGKESAFLLQDMFPVTRDYIEREYTIGQNHMVLVYDKDISAIAKAAKRVITLLKRGVKFTPTAPDIQRIFVFLERGEI